MVRVLIAGLCCLVATEAAAQGAFVQAGYTRDVKRFSHEGASSVFDSSADGFSAAVGAFVAPRWSLGVEMDFGGPSSVTDTVSVAIAGRPTDIRTTYSTRRRGVSALVGFHVPGSPAIQVGCYGGITFSAFRREIASDAPAIVLEEPASASVLNERVTSAIVGVDVAVKVTPHLAIVPALRAQGLSLSGGLAGFSLRPSLSARVVF
jgi:hypothetical protein